MLLEKRGEVIDIEIKKNVLFIENRKGGRKTELSRKVYLPQ
jgi:hypothetical protein